MRNEVTVKKVIVVGGGFGGLAAVRELVGLKRSLPKHTRLKIELLDLRNYHLFQPLLYQVAMAALSPADIAIPIRSVFSRSKEVSVRLEKVSGIRLNEAEIETLTGNRKYDYLILACGSRHSYFGNPEWEEFAPGLKTLEQATEIRRRVLLAFEKAEKEDDVSRQKEHLTFAIIGGGPTGVELAGALGEISKFTLSKDFRRIDPARTRIVLIEAGPRILPTFSEDLSKKASRDLESIGVQLWTGSRVTQIDSQGIHLSGEVLKAGTVIWAAGVKPSELNETLSHQSGAALDRLGRITVNQDCSLLQHPKVFVIGDQSCIESKDGKSYPSLAPVAIQQGKFVARQIGLELKGKPRERFRYFDKGQMATIGRKHAVAQFAGFEFSGFIAWLGWLLIHIYYLIGFRNRFFVFMQWAWSYIHYGRGARLIVDKEWKTES